MSSLHVLIRRFLKGVERRSNVHGGSGLTLNDGSGIRLSGA